MRICLIKVSLYLFLTISLCIIAENSDHHRNLRGKNNSEKKVRKIQNKYSKFQNYSQKWNVKINKWNHFKSYLDSDVKPRTYGDGVIPERGYARDEYLSPNQKRAMKYRQGPDVDFVMSTSEKP